MKHFVAIVLLCCASAAARAADKLTILKAGPVGEVASLAEANEIRVVFSEPMIVVGKIPKDLVVPWFHIAPRIIGTFRWSGTTTLIFTPDPKTPLPFATQYDVTIDAEARSVAGHILGKPYGFSFITPTILLKNTNFYRNGDGSVVIALRFNQPVDAQTIVNHLQLRTASHDFNTPQIPNPERLTPAELQAFEAKKALAAKTAASDGATILSFVTTEWDTKRLGLPSPDLIVLQTKPNVPVGPVTATVRPWSGIEPVELEARRDQLADLVRLDLAHRGAGRRLLGEGEAGPIAERHARAVGTLRADDQPGDER